MKVFLSHSSFEKDFVEKVAERLGRANAQLDKYVFRTGDDLRAGIK